MDGLLLERIPGLPEQVLIEVGEQRALVMPTAAAARRLADLVIGVEDPPAGAVVKTGGAVRLVPAEGGLLPHLTVLGNVIHGHTVAHRVTRQAAKDAAPRRRSGAGWRTCWPATHTRSPQAVVAWPVWPEHSAPTRG